VTPRARRLGEIVARYVADMRPADERVVVMGTGGLFIGWALPKWAAPIPPSIKP
jgi:hypothetical protein